MVLKEDKTGQAECRHVYRGRYRRRFRATGRGSSRHHDLGSLVADLADGLRVQRPGAAEGAQREPRVDQVLGNSPYTFELAKPSGSPAVTAIFSMTEAGPEAPWAMAVSYEQLGLRPRRGPGGPLALSSPLLDPAAQDPGVHRTMPEGLVRGPRVPRRYVCSCMASQAEGGQPGRPDWATWRQAVGPIDVLCSRFGSFPILCPAGLL